MSPPVVLTVAGTDSGGGAGIAADLATFAALGVHGCCVVTAVTAQSTTALHQIHVIPSGSVGAQIDAVLGDLPVAVVKTGMLAHADHVRLVAERLGRHVLVVDPVLVASTGAALADTAIRDAYICALFPIAAVVTPNLHEARVLTGLDAAPAILAESLCELGPAVVVTGGPPPGTSPPRAATCTDWVAMPGQAAVPLTHPLLHTTNDHGTGCTFSAALAAYLALGAPLLAASAKASQFTARQLRIARLWSLGHGRGPIAHVLPDPANATK